MNKIPGQVSGQKPEVILNGEAGEHSIERILRPDIEDSLGGWVRLYWQTRVMGTNPRTRNAKEQDLKRFVAIFGDTLGHDKVDGWTPSFTLQLQRALSAEGLKPTTINRVFATLRHFATWVAGQRRFLAGSPFEGVRDIAIDAPDWRGVTDVRLTRLRGAIDMRLKACGRKNQNPQLEAAMFYTLLHTGLRVGELVALELEQYHHRGFHDVARKGKRVQTKVPVPIDAREYIDRYLDERREREPGPLFLSKSGRRLHVNAVAEMCARLAAQAAVVGEDEPSKLTPHMLRHTFLKRYADKYGVHAAQAASGNVSFREIFRYTKPSPDELEEQAAALYG